MPLSRDAMIVSAAYCDELERTSHGSVALSKTSSLGSVARYSCDDGYILQGSSVRECMAYRPDAVFLYHWSGTAPTCKRTLSVTVSYCIGESTNSMFHFSVSRIVRVDLRFWDRSACSMTLWSRWPQSHDQWSETGSELRPVNICLSNYSPHRPLSRRLDRCDRIIQNESRDPNGGKMPARPLCSIRLESL